MGDVRTYEEFPASLVSVSVLVMLSIYALGTLILARIGAYAAGVYLLYCALFELRVMKQSCVNCCYYGKMCGMGKGRISAYLFPRGDPGVFAHTEITWSMLIPDLLVMLLPLLGGTILLVRSFSWAVAAGMALLAALSLGGNAFVRTRIACKYCRQREIGCPAEKLFGGQKQGDVPAE